MERPTRFSVDNSLRTGPCVELARKLPGKTPGLIAVEKPVGTDQPLEQKHVLVDADNPCCAKSVDLFNGDGVTAACGDIHVGETQLV